MIKSLRLRNFKSFKDTGTMEIKPLTILVGSNSAGKSSIFQSLLLLRQTLDSDDLDVSLELQGDFMKIGNFNDLVFGKPPLGRSELSYEFDVTAPDDINDWIKNPSPARPKRPRFYDETTHIELAFQYRAGKTRVTKLRTSSETGLDMRSTLNRDLGYNTHVSRVRVADEVDASRRRSRSEGSQRAIRLDDVYSKPDRNGLRSLRVFSREAEWDHFLPTEMVHDAVGGDDFSSRFRLPLEVTRSPMWANLNELGNTLRYQTHYLGPLRSEPERVYLQGSSRETIGPRGEGTIQVLYRNRADEAVVFDDLAGAPKVLTLEQGIASEFSKLGLTQMPEVRSQQGLLYQMLFPIHSQTRNAHVTIADVGFGISQILPILVMGLRAHAFGGSLLLFEQPEIHLHPRLQANIGDFFLGLAKTGRTVMIETHSEHLINRIRRRIAESHDNQLSDMVNILFVRPGGHDHEGSVIETLKVNEFGAVENWPDDFFPEAEDETGRILNAALLKRRRRRDDTSSP